MQHYRLGAQTKTDLKVHLVWIPKYRKKVLIGDVATRTRDILRKIAMEHDLIIISGKVCNNHIHVFLSYRPNQSVSKIVQWLKGISSWVLLQEFPHLRKKVLGEAFLGKRLSCCEFRKYYRRDDTKVYRRTGRGTCYRCESISNRQNVNPSPSR